MSKKSTMQYQPNIDIIKGFFRKPIVLVLGILTIVVSIANSVINYIAEYKFNDILNVFLGNNDYPAFYINGTPVAVGIQNDSSAFLFPDVFAIALGISLILLFAFGRSRGNAIQGGVTFFKVMAHIYYVFYFIVAVFAVVMVIFTFVFSADNIIKLILIASFLAIGLFMFLTGYSQLQFAKSVKESINSIYISNSGAKLHGILRIIGAAVVGIISAVAALLIISWGGFNNALIPVGLVPPVVLLMANNVLWAIFAFKYYNYVKGITSGKIEMPVNLPMEEKEMICNNCGSTLTNEDVFCAVCGTKVE